jgi:signal transduction histidine kinase
MKTADSPPVAPVSLEHAVEQIQDAHRLTTAFLGKLVHELGNQFLPYHFALQLLQQASASPATVGQVRAMLEEHQASVDRFMSDLPLVSRLARGKLKLQRQPLDLAAIVEQSLTRAMPAIDKHRLRLWPDLPAQPLRLEGDPALLGRSVDHLLQNAVKFTPSQGQIWVTLKQENAQHVLRIRDSGAGIAPEQLPQLFHLFFQADPTVAGWGAGLATVRAAVELHGGRVEASSPGLGQGSEFVVRFPAG